MSQIPQPKQSIVIEFRTMVHFTDSPGIPADEWGRAYFDHIPAAGEVFQLRFPGGDVTKMSAVVLGVSNDMTIHARLA